MIKRRVNNTSDYMIMTTSSAKFSLVHISLVTALSLSLVASVGFVGLSSTSAAQQKKLCRTYSHA